MKFGFFFLQNLVQDDQNHLNHDHHFDEYLYKMKRNVNDVENYDYYYYYCLLNDNHFQ